jgi:hypothetical protein
MSDSGDATRLVAFHRARSAWEAQIIAAVLADAGIPAFVAGGLLTDEFAMSQRLMNLQNVEIQVPYDRVDDARDALAAARDAGKMLDEDIEVEAAAAAAAPRTEPQPRNGARLMLPIMLGTLVVVFGSLWLGTRADLRRSLRTPLWDTELTSTGARLVWTHNGAPCLETFDRDNNGIPEQTTSFNRDGRQTSSSYDEDQNGLFERVVHFDLRDRRIAESLDHDQDGLFDVWTECHADGTTSIWNDADNDGLFDRCEIKDRTGAVILVQERRSREGIVTVR